MCVVTSKGRTSPVNEAAVGLLELFFVESRMEDQNPTVSDCVHQEAASQSKFSVQKYFLTNACGSTPWKGNLESRRAERTKLSCDAGTRTV